MKKHNNISSNISYGFSSTPFGECCIAFDKNNIFALIYADNTESSLQDLQKRFPKAVFTLNNEQAKELALAMFAHKFTLPLKPQGTDFQQMVWEALQKIPFGKTSTYSEIAKAINRPKAYRAVANAIGANPIAYFIPCHRVVRNDGTLGGFRWGLSKKREMLASEQKNTQITTSYF